MNSTDVLNLLRSETPLPPVMCIASAQAHECQSFFVRGYREKFLDLTEFVASALRSVAQELGIEDTEIRSPLVTPLSAQPWQVAYDFTVKPGSMLCFPPADALGFEPPSDLQKRFFLQPNLMVEEECFVCDTQNEFVLLYWHTTG